MVSLMRRDIEIIGIDTMIPIDISLFKEFMINERVYIPKERPKINTIMKTAIRGRIEKYRYISRSKQELLNVQGELLVRVEYTSIDNENLIYTNRFKKVFNIDIPISGKINPYTNIIVNLFIEDLYIRKISEIHYLFNTYVLVTIEE